MRSTNGRGETNMIHHICHACGDGFECKPSENMIGSNCYCDECYDELQNGELNPRSFNVLAPYKHGLTPRQRHKLGETT